MSSQLASQSEAIPHLDGYRVVWSDDFQGLKGSPVDFKKWNQLNNPPNSNGELQIYSDYASNAHLSGDGQLYIVPKKSTNGQFTSWTSARLESTGSWTPGAGKAMIYQSEILVPDFTGSPAKFQGLWPAFWTKGDSFRTSNVPWPKCGEWDILEIVDKIGNQNYANMHWVDANGQDRNDAGGVSYQGGAYHTWGLKVDRRNDDWTKQTITAYLDGKAFYHLAGAKIGTFEQWKELAWSPYYIILNVAVGGSYPGPPTDETVDGFEASMRVKYVAVYETT
ncbi:glycoside hydrolase family 16 protein [Stipitochalara longipes BDJ]|nr:glycoside hydrolase family 16 protein [Stipitochalara longipes BDJ]